MGVERVLMINILRLGENVDRVLKYRRLDRFFCADDFLPLSPPEGGQSPVLSPRTHLRTLSRRSSSRHLSTFKQKIPSIYRYGGRM